MAIIICPECGEKISDTVNTCIHCGVSIKVCPECGVISTGDTKYCNNCGYPFQKNDSEADGNKLINCNSAKDVMYEWKKRNYFYQLLSSNAIWLALIAISVILLIAAAAKLLLWNDVFTSNETFSSIRTLLVLSALFYVLQLVLAEVGEYYYVVLLSAWCVGNKLNLVSIVETTLKMDFDSMSMDEVGSELGGTQWCVKAAAYSEDGLIRSKEQRSRFIKVGIGVIAIIFLCIFLIHNVEVYMRAEIWESDILGNEGFAFSMIENWWLLIVALVLLIVKKIVGKRNDNNDENICDTWVSKNIPNCVDSYLKYAKAENFAEYLLNRSEKAN